jgi:hypothetical protein
VSPGCGAGAAALVTRASALQQQYHFRYPMPDRVGERLAHVKTDGATVLTDDFAPVDIYRDDAAAAAEGSVMGLPTQVAGV